MQYSFLIVGFGNIGKRYLESIISSKLDCKIYIYDLDKKKYYYNKSKKNFIFLNDFNKIPKKLDICFFSSNSNKRCESIKHIFKFTSPRFVMIEKVLSQSKKDLTKILSFFKNKKMLKRVWVNTHYRTYKIFKNTINQDKNDYISNITVTGNNWGLACNAIHYIDLYSHIFKSKVSKIDGSKLDKKWFKSKRSGFYEIFGTLKITLKNNKIINLICKKSELEPSTVHEIEISKNRFYKIHEESGEIQLNFSRVSNFIFDPLSVKMKNFVIQIVKYNKCNLANITDSTQQHLKFISELVRIWNKTHKKKITNIKVT
jgi:hypothetical protein